MQTKISPCYEIETRKYSDGVLDVSATYIIHLKNNGREREIESKLSSFHPSHTIHILHNEGYKKCKKVLEKQLPPYDLTHAFTSVFRDAHSRGYGSIMILEDDFQFDIGEMHNHASVINDFMYSHNSEKYILKLGVVPFLLVPNLDKHHTYKGLTTGMHCCIYSASYISNVLTQSPQISDWDVHHNIDCDGCVYIYYKSLCYQLFPQTENQKHWGESNILYYTLGLILKKIFGWLQMDTSFIAYPYLYLLAKLWFWFILFIVLVFIVMMVWPSQWRKYILSRKLFRNTI